MVITDIKNKIFRGRCGTLYFLDSFPQFDTEYVRKVLSSLVEDGTLVRLTNGVFLKPTKTRFGILYPEVGTIVKAIAERDHAMIIAEGNAALHQLGLSTQVPTKYVYLTNGSARKLRLGNQEVQLKHGMPKNFAFYDPFMATLHQALKTYGNKPLNEEEKERIRKVFRTYANPQYIAHDIAILPVWMQKLLKE